MKFLPLLLCLVLPSSLAAREFSSALVSKRVNDVKIFDKKKAVRQAKTNERINIKNLLKTGRRSRAELTFPNKSITRLGSNTSFSFKGADRTLNLKNGTMLLQVPENLGGATIHTSSVTAAITGTTIMFEFNEGKWIKLIALEGKVSFNPQGQRKVSIAPGQMVYLKPNGKVLAKPVDIDLARLVKTSYLLREDVFGKLPNGAMQRIQKVIEKQKQAMKKGNLVRQNISHKGPASLQHSRTQRVHGGGGIHHDTPGETPGERPEPIVQPRPVEPNQGGTIVSPIGDL